MAISITTIARTTLLTSVIRLRAKLGTSLPASQDPALEDLIRDASAAIVSYCNREFARETISETCPGFGDVHLSLSRGPIVSVSSVLLDSLPITDYSIASRDLQTLYRRAGWGWTVQVYPGLSAGMGRFVDGTLFDMGSPLPGREEPSFEVDYTAGYVLPSQFVTGSATLSVDASDDSFNDSESRFPTNLVAGDIVEAVGFSSPSNIGRHVVTGTPTASKIATTSTLVTEAAGGARDLLFHPPAPSRPVDDLERACFETVKSWLSGRARDSAVVERQIASTRVRYSEVEAARMLGIPPAAAGLLERWVRRRTAGGGNV